MAEDKEEKKDAIVVKEKEDKIVKPTKEPQFNDEFRRLTEVQKNDFYEIWDSKTRSKKLEPSARVLRNWANDKRINTEIKQVVIDPNYVQVMVHGWIGMHDKPQIETTEIVTINFMDYARQWIFDLLRKSPDTPISYEPGPMGMPFPTDGTIKLDWLSYINRKKMFADREAETKAESRIFKKLLGFEWRDKEEVEAEAEDVKIVQDGIKKENDGDGPTCIACGITMKRSQYERKDGKLWYCPTCKGVM